MVEEGDNNTYFESKLFYKYNLYYEDANYNNNENKIRLFYINISETNVENKYYTNL